MEMIAAFPDISQWNAYVGAHPAARFCQLAQYDCIATVYGYTAWRLAFVNHGRIVGVLPAFEARSVLFGRKLVSQPFSEYGGLLLDAQLSAADVQLIIASLRRFLVERRLPVLEMHGCCGTGAQHLGSFVLRNEHQSAQLALNRPLDEIWERVVSYDVRKAVRKAERAGLKVEERSDEQAIVRDFYPLYLASMKRLGAPAHSVEYYLACKRAFGTAMKIFWTKDGDIPLAGLLGFTCGQRVTIINTVSDERHWQLRPNDLVHWEFIKWAHSEGYTVFDFGSVRYEGQLRYKKKWGCTFAHHAYYFLPVQTGTAKVRTFNSSSGAMKAFARVWSAHVPMAVAERFGPYLRRHLVR